MRIVIDRRERELIAKTSESLLRLPEEDKKHIEIIVEDLLIGDILIQNNENTNLLIIERKTFPDLLASVKDGRYAEQSHRLTNTSDVPKHCIIYLLEGMFSTVQPYQKKIIYSCMTSIHYFKNFSVMRTSSVYETGDWLIAMTEKLGRDLSSGRVHRNLPDASLPVDDQDIREPIPTLLNEGFSVSDRRSQPCTTFGGAEEPHSGIEKPRSFIDVTERSSVKSTNDGDEREPTTPLNYCNFVKKVKKENITPENIGEIVLSQIPGISSVTAIAIMKKFSTFPKLMSALKEDPCCMDDIVTESNDKVRKISKSSIANIKKFFT